MTRKQKIIVAELSALNPDEVAQQLAQFLKHLPGDVWDNRLPQPLTGGAR